MRPLTSPVHRASRRNYRAGEVAVVIGLIALRSLITLIVIAVIGLSIMVALDIIRPEQIPNILNNFGQDLGGRYSENLRGQLSVLLSGTLLGAP
jgi:hypothetical protein